MTRKEGDVSAKPEGDNGRIQERGTARVLNKADLAHSEIAYEFEGHHYGLVPMSRSSYRGAAGERPEAAQASLRGGLRGARG
jgi:hypothetical protein